MRSLKHKISFKKDKTIYEKASLCLLWMLVPSTFSLKYLPMLVDIASSDKLIKIALELVKKGYIVDLKIRLVPLKVNIYSSKF
jgi:hypothetical protein